MSPERAELYTPIRYGDVLFAASGEKIDEIGKSAVNLLDGDAVCGGDMIVFRAALDVHAPFLGYAFDNRYTATQKATMCRGTTIKHIYPDELRGLLVLLPPPAEQAAIARFLDWANGRLERAIRAKRKVIALLGEQRQAIIQRAVTRGLDPTVPLKPSGIPWLGEIPAHWEVWRISRFARVGNGSTPSRAIPSYWRGGLYPWLNSSQVNRGYIDSADQFVTQLALRECHLPKVQVGSVLVAITGQGKTRGMSAVLGIEATINQHIAFVTPRMTVTSPAFVHLALTAAYRQLRASSDDAGSTKGAITCEDLRRFKLPMPPRAEQEDLVQRVQSETREVDEAISRLDREIDLLCEYRTRLVADVVTGKLDVRDAAARLPDEAPLDTIDDGADLTDDSDIADEESKE